MARTIQRYILKSKWQAKISETRTLIAFRNFVRNEPLWSCDVRLVTIWPHLISLSSTTHSSVTLVIKCVFTGELYGNDIYRWFYTRNPMPYFLWIFFCFHEILFKLSSGHQYLQWLFMKTLLLSQTHMSWCHSQIKLCDSLRIWQRNN